MLKSYLLGSKTASKCAPKGFELPLSETGSKKEIKIASDSTYRLRLEDSRVFNPINKEEKKGFVFDILTSEQAHKNM